MSTLKETLRRKIEEHRPRTVRLLKEYGDVKLSDVTIAQAIGGARGVRCLVTDTSYLDPMEGIRFRGKTIPETFEALPKYPGSDYPSVESFWWFIMTGDVPNEAQANEVIADWKKRAEVPSYVFDLLRTMPRDSHPMTMYSAAILAMQKESLFADQYRAGKVGKAGSVIVKFPKKGHYMRFDIPVVGVKTFKVMKKAKVSCLAVEAGKTILLEKEKLVALADQYDMAFVAVETGDNA